MTDLSQYSDEQLIGMLSQHATPNSIGNAIGNVAAYNPSALGNSPHPVNNALNYAAQGFARTGNAIYGAGVDLTDKLGLLDAGMAAKQKAILASANKGLPKRYPTEPGIEQYAGEAVGNAVPAFAGMMGGGPVAAGAIGGGASALTGTPPEAEASDKLVNTGIGAGLGALMAKGLTSLVGPSQNYLTDEEKRLAQVMKENGVQLTPAQATGNKTFKIMEGTFNNLPITASIQDSVTEEQNEAFTQAVLAKAGINSTSASPEILSKGYQNAGGMIEQITAKHTMPVDNQLVGDVMKTMDEYGQTITPSERPQFQEWADKITSGNSMPGELYQQTRSGLGKIANSAWQRDPTYARAVDALQSNMDDAMTRGMLAKGATDDVAALQEARTHYGNMKTVMRAMNTGSEAALSGDIPPARLGQALRTGNPTGYVTGSGDLNDLSRAGEAFLKPSMGDSGTAARSGMADLMKGKWGPVLGAGGAGMAAGGAPVAGLAAGTTLGLPAAIQQIYNRMPNYMVNGLPGATPMALKLAALLQGQNAGNFVAGQ